MLQSDMVGRQVRAIIERFVDKLGEVVLRLYDSLGQEDAVGTDPELLEELAEDFRSSGQDLKHRRGQIGGSTTYKGPASPNDSNIEEKRNYQGPRRGEWDAEALFEAKSTVTGSYGDFGEATTDQTAYTRVFPDWHR